MTGTGDWPSDKPAATQIAELPETERRILAALAIVGRASLSAEELAELAEAQDITPLVADLEQLGLIKREETQRYSALGRVGEGIRQTDSALSSGERLLQYMTTLAKGGQLTPERLLDDAEAVLGLTEWAAERQRWKRLLELVKTLQACIGMVNRVEEWLTLLDRGLAAARALNDWQSEVWVLQQLATASAGTGDPSAAQRYLHEADELQRTHRSSLGRISNDRGISAVSGDGTTRIASWMIGLIAAVAAAAGGATGYAIGNSAGNDSVDSTTTRVPVIATVGGHTVTTSQTLTLPAKTVTTSNTVTLPPTTVFSTTTVTTTVTVPAPPTGGE